MPVSSIAVLELAPVDARRALAKDAEDSAPGPLPFAVPMEVAVAPDSHGAWEPVAGGGRLWRHRIRVAGATDLNFGFTRYRLPPGATLHLISEDDHDYEGPYTSGDNETHGELWTPLVAGEAVVIELYVPPRPLWTPELELTVVGAGYRDMLGRKGGPYPKRTASQCHLDTVCYADTEVDDLARSVALYTTNATSACTGTLVADTTRSFRPLFLTAHHCGVKPANARSMVVYWNFQSPRCGQLGGGSRRDTTTGGARLLAARANVDFALFRLNRHPEASFNVYYSGWDASNARPRSGVVEIHHPQGDEKAVSVDFDPLRTVNNCIGRGNRTHWRVNWDLGTTEPGSSGSGLWDLDSLRLVGFLSGGDAACLFGTVNNGLPDCYGKFSVAWNGKTRRHRLRDHLNPRKAAAVVSADGADPPLAVALDVAPGQCPNQLARHGGRSSASLTLAILGRDDLEVARIDLETLELEGVPPLPASASGIFKDVATAVEPHRGDAAALGCTKQGPDGLTDLVLHFDAQAVVDSLGPLAHGDVARLRLTGELLDGTPISGEDAVVIVDRMRLADR